MTLGYTGLKLIAFQEQLPGTFHEQQVGRRTADLTLSVQLDHFWVFVLIVIWIERLRLPSRLQVFSQFPGLEDGLDLSHEGRDLRTELKVVFSGFEEVQELLTDQIVEGILSAKLSLDLESCIALFFPDFAESHWMSSSRCSHPPSVVLRERVLHVPGSRPSNCITVMPGNHPQCHIDARRDPRRGEQVALLDDVLIIDHVDSREQSSHLLQNPPVGGRPSAIQQSSFAEEQRPGADRGQRRDLTSLLPEPGDQSLVHHLSASSPAAWNDEHVKRRAVLQAVLGNDF